MLKNLEIAIVYDWIDKWGGVERVLLALHEIFPKAPIYTSYYDEKGASWAKNLKIKTSFMQKLPEFIKKSRILSFPFYPFAFESFDFSNYDVVISVTSSFAKSIITKPNTFHLCYLLTPTRYLFVMPKEYGVPSVPYLKKWDYVAAQRPDRIISISKTVADRCRKFYRRDSEVIYPPFDIGYWTRIKSQFPISNFQTNFIRQIGGSNFKNYYLVVSRLEAYKKVDLVIKVFNKLKNERLIVIGEGSEREKLHNLANQNITFINYLPDKKLAQYYKSAQALIMPQEEDFGYISLEAQFFGCPVIAYNKGGAQETVIEGKTGIFFNNQTEKSLREALERFHMLSYNLKKRTRRFGLENVRRFDKEIFVNSFLSVIPSGAKRSRGI